MACTYCGSEFHKTGECPEEEYDQNIDLYEPNDDGDEDLIPYDDSDRDYI